jgi:hypothetical protein
MSDLLPWLTLFGLGAYHGINPGMGWLFAVALGLQEKKRRAVLAAIPPIALGHALSIGITVGLLYVLQASVPHEALRYGAAAVLFGFGFFRLFRSRHPKWVGMRVGFIDLTVWSFLMASAHGAGLMLVPILFGWQTGSTHGAHSEHLSHIEDMGPVSAQPLKWLAAVGVHSSGHLLVALIIALLVYEKFGLAMLRTAWLNLDLVWMIALMISGILILII